jgi:transcriptional regulator with XRE-family HTH domain
MGDSDADHPSVGHDDDVEQRRTGARLREAREYVGLRQEHVADALGIPRASVSAIESGKRRVTSLELRRLARLYRRSVAWMVGEEESPTEIQGALFRAAAELSDDDREQVLRFAQFLASAGPPNRPGSSQRDRAAGHQPEQGKPDKLHDSS